MDIRRDDLQASDVIALLREHVEAMRAVSPPESCHTLALDGLRRADVSFWVVRDGQALAGCGGLKELDPLHAEIKSMRTAGGYRRRGVASRLLEHMLGEAQRRGYRRLSLETGAMDYFAPARRLYARFGFEACAPFGGYLEDPNSVFMTREIATEH